VGLFERDSNVSCLFFLKKKKFGKAKGERNDNEGRRENERGEREKEANGNIGMISLVGWRV
jgi:hypothetical protein